MMYKIETIAANFPATFLIASNFNLNPAPSKFTGLLTGGALALYSLISSIAFLDSSSICSAVTPSANCLAMQS